MYQDIDQESQTICLSDGRVLAALVADRSLQPWHRGPPRCPRYPRVISVPGLGPIPVCPRTASDADRSTNSIESLALIDNYVPPQSEDGVVDPILASVVSVISAIVGCMMKHFTDVKPTGTHRERITPCGFLRCLPSDANDPISRSHLGVNIANETEQERATGPAFCRWAQQQRSAPTPPTLAFRCFRRRCHEPRAKVLIGSER